VALTVDPSPPRGTGPASSRARVPLFDRRAQRMADERVVKALLPVLQADMSGRIAS